MKFKVMFALLIVVGFGCCYFTVTEFFMKKIHENEQSNQNATTEIKKIDKVVSEKITEESIDNAPLDETVTKASSEPEVEVDNAPVEVEPPKAPIVQQKTYTAQEIKNAREYVGNYRYIKREINKTALKCVAEKGFDITVCESLSRKRYNMSNDPESISRMDAKYKEQLKIVQSSQ